MAFPLVHASRPRREKTPGRWRRSRGNRPGRGNRFSSGSRAAACCARGFSAAARTTTPVGRSGPAPSGWPTGTPSRRRPRFPAPPNRKPHASSRVLHEERHGARLPRVARRLEHTTKQNITPPPSIPRATRREGRCRQGRGSPRDEVCSECGRVQEFGDPELDRLIHENAELAGFELDGHSLALYGRCERCA